MWVACSRPGVRPGSGGGAEPVGATPDERRYVSAGYKLTKLESHSTTVVCRDFRFKAVGATCSPVLCCLPRLGCSGTGPTQTMPLHCC